jgi:cyclohexanecarboxylate-CoA ligase
VSAAEPGRHRSARDAKRAEWRSQGWYPPLTVGQAIALAAAEHSDATIVFAPVEGLATTHTLSDLHAGAVRVASRLRSAGVATADSVIVQAPADERSTEVFAALWHLGATVVPVAATATPQELRHVAHETGAGCAIVASTWRGRDLASEALGVKDSGLLGTVLTLGDGPAGTTPLDSLDGDEPDPPTDLAPSSVACVLYTSGSTADPKGVRHSHETLLVGLGAVPSDPSTRTLATFPAGHVASLLGLLRPLTSGGFTVVMDRWSARAAVQLIETHRITVSSGTPFFLSTLLDEAERSGRDISSLKRFLVGAAAVSPELVQRAERAGILAWRTYGSTEHPVISSGGPDDPFDKRCFTDGRVGPGNEIRLVDESGKDVPAGEEGEIVARGPRQFLGYQDPSADESAFLDETWFRTGDLARLDADGYLIVTDRVKDIIIRGGENISAREVEEVLGLHPSIAEVAVCAAPDKLFGEAVCAVVVARGGVPEPSLDELIDHARRLGLAPHKLPSRLVVLLELPRTASGKVKKRDLRPFLA